MSSRKVSIALDADNLLWLNSQAITSGHRDLSEALNTILAKLRADGPFEVSEPQPEPAFEVTARISESDPDLRQADAAIRKLFARSLEQTAEALQSPRAEPH